MSERHSLWIELGDIRCVKTYPARVLWIWEDDHWAGYPWASSVAVEQRVKYDGPSCYRAGLAPLGET